MCLNCGRSEHMKKVQSKRYKLCFLWRLLQVVDFNDSRCGHTRPWMDKMNIPAWWLTSGVTAPSLNIPLILKSSALPQISTHSPTHSFVFFLLFTSAETSQTMVISCMCVSLCVGMQVSKDSPIEGIKERRGMGQLLQEMESVCVCVGVCT